MMTPTMPQPIMAAHNTASALSGLGLDPAASARAANSPKNAPSMYTSPWAKLMSLRMPYTIV